MVGVRYVINGGNDCGMDVDESKAIEWGCKEKRK